MLFDDYFIFYFGIQLFFLILIVPINQKEPSQHEKYNPFMPTYRTSISRSKGTIYRF